MQFNSLFFRIPKPTYTSVSISLLLRSELIYVSSSSQQKRCLSCACGPATNADLRNIPVLLSKAEPSSKKYLMYFHSMAEDMKDAYDLLLPIQNKLGVNVILVEYPGYGIYQNAEPSAELITQDANDVYDYMINKRHVSREDIVIMGRSMGTGPACYLASKYNPRAVILLSPYTSLRRAAAHFVGTFMSKLVRDRFENIEIIKNVVCPILVIHGIKDEMIPQEQSLQLIAAAKSRIKQFHFPENMTHNKFDYEEDFEKQLNNFLKKIDFIEEQIIFIEPFRNISNHKQRSLILKNTTFNLMQHSGSDEDPSYKDITVFISPIQI